MSWEQHRYAVERAAAMRRKIADEHNEASQGVNLQGEANGSDAEMLEEVADFLKRRDEAQHGRITGDAEFIRDWNQMVERVANFADKYQMRKPTLLFDPMWNYKMRQIAASPIADTIIYQEVLIRFGRLETVTAIKS